MEDPKDARIRKTELPPGNEIPKELKPVLDDIDARLAGGDLAWFEPTPIHFPALDTCLEGGFHPEDLILVGGPQNVGKTAFLLQVARQIARAGKQVLYICYEHSPMVLAERILCQESDEMGSGFSIGQLHNAYLKALEKKKGIVSANPSAPAPGMLDIVADALGPSGYEVISRVDSYWHNLLLVRGDGLSTTIEAIENYIQLVHKHFSKNFCLFVDYAQRVPVMPKSGVHLDYLQRIDMVLRGLKSYAVKYHMPVAAVSAADMAGLRQGHIHVENLWGPETVQYEPDLCFILNPIWESQARLAIEKNRHGVTDKEWDIEFRGPYYRFSTEMREVPPADSWQKERGRLIDRAITAAKPLENAASAD
jgi:replicative DNA helicase